MSDRPIRVLIADDELLGRQRIEDMLRHEQGVEIVAMVEDGNAAVDAIRAQHPDLVFLDVQMPGRTGLDVVRDVGADVMPATIFVTAYDQHALTAFDLAAVDYLVKPFDDERFEQAFHRARRMIELQEVERLRGQLLAVLGGSPSSGTAPASSGSGGNGGSEPPAQPPTAKGAYLERFAVESRGRVRVIPATEVDYIVASGPYAELHVGDRRYLIRESMQALEERLDPKMFLRIHRSGIVRIALVDTLLKGAGGDYEIVLKNGVRMRVSRSRREELERVIGISG